MASPERAGYNEPSLSGINQQGIALGGLTAYINAGGRGTRLSSIFNPHEKKGISKALLPIGDPPISMIEHHVNRLLHSGIPTIVVGVGDHENVREYVQSRYQELTNVHAIQYDHQLGTGGDLVRAVREYPELFSSRIYIACVDVLLDISETEFLASHQGTGAEASIALTLNKGVPNEGAYFVASDSRVIYCGEASSNIITAEEATQACQYRGSSTGALIVNKETIQDISWEPKDGSLSLYSTVVAISLAKQTMFAFNNGERLFTDVGTVMDWNNAQANHAMIAPYIHY